MMSPTPAMLPSGLRAVIPEMNTSFPAASTTVAWEKTPLGFRSFGLEISALAIACFLGGDFEREGDVEFSSEAVQHRYDLSVDADRAFRILAPLPLRFSGREQPVDAGSTGGRTDSRAGRRGTLAESIQSAELRDVDGHEKV